MDNLKAAEERNHDLAAAAAAARDQATAAQEESAALRQALAERDEAAAAEEELHARVILSTAFKRQSMHLAGCLYIMGPGNWPLTLIGLIMPTRVSVHRSYNEI